MDAGEALGVETGTAAESGSKKPSSEKWDVKSNPSGENPSKTAVSTGGNRAADLGREGVGIEGNDTEVGFMASFWTYVGGDGDNYGFGLVQLSYGKFISSKLEIGVAPQLFFLTGSDSEDPIINASLFFRYNFSTTSRTIPYITVLWYQTDFSPEEGADFIDYSAINFGLGLRNFFNSYAALNTTVNYGFGLSDTSEGGVLQVLCGLSFFF